MALGAGPQTPWGQTNVLGLEMEEDREEAFLDAPVLDETAGGSG